MIVPLGDPPCERRVRLSLTPAICQRSYVLRGQGPFREVAQCQSLLTALVGGDVDRCACAGAAGAGPRSEFTRLPPA